MKYKKVSHALLGIGLSACIAAAPVFSHSVYAEPDTVESLEQEQKKLENEKAASQQELNQLQAKLDDLIAKANELENQLISKGEEIIKTKEELADAQKREREQYEAMKLRIKYVYENGTGMTAEKVLQSKSVSDILSKAEYAQKVQEYDRNALQKYADTVAEVDEKKTTLEKEMERLQQLQTEYRAKQDELGTTITEASAHISNLDGMIQEAAKKVADKKAEEAARKAAEEAARKAAEEAARKAAEEAAQRQAASNASNNASSANASDPGTSNSTASDPGASSNPAPAPAPAPEPSYNASTGNAIVDRAYSWVGRAEYVWGGCSPGAFDCSGFVSYCLTGSYTRLGTTYNFMGWNRVSDPQPGDVAVNWTHTGIYIGNGRMIHAADYGIGVIEGPVQGGMIFVRY